MASLRKQSVGEAAALPPSAHRPLARVLTSPAFLAGALVGLAALLGWTFWPMPVGDETMRDALGDGERDFASLAFLFLKAPVSMIAGGLALDFLSRRVFGKGGTT